MSKRSVMLSVMTLVLCVALVAGGSYALFSETVTITNHLRAGTMDITLTRTELVTVSLDPSTGLLVRTQNTEDVDFSDPTARSVFDITDQMLLVPGSYYQAEMQIANHSDVAFGYWLEIVFSDELPELADQLQVKVTTAAGTREALLSESAGTIGNAGAPIGVLDKTQSASFTVSVEFLDLTGANDVVKSQNLYFDVIVHAVQSATLPA